MPIINNLPDRKDLENKFAILREQSREIEAQISRLQKINHKIVTKANEVRREYKAITGDWINNEGKIIEMNEALERFSE